MRNFFKNKWVKFSIASSIYLLWVVWDGNYWLLIGIPTFFLDFYVTNFVNWTFWKKRGLDKKERSKLVEWIDAIVFAVIFASIIRMFIFEAFTIPTSSMEKTLLVGDFLFVSKVAYGPRIPNTPISFPFAHNTLPFTTFAKSYNEWVKWPYKRLMGYSRIKRNDIVVFNFPEGDTIALKIQNPSYYELCRQYGKERVWNDEMNFGQVISRPVDKRENYIKRCVAIPGDKLEVRHGDVYINDNMQNIFEKLQYNYIIRTDGSPINPVIMQGLGISNEDLSNSVAAPDIYILPLSLNNVEKIKAFSNVKSIQRFEFTRMESVYPQDSTISFNRDNYGPITIPKKGLTVKLDIKNLTLYQRVITAYELNKLEVRNGKIFINNKETDSYTFKMDYYFMMGDNRHNSMDSRFWGFVPEDHVVGKPVFIWFSMDKDKSWYNFIRFSRIFRVIKP